MDASLMNRFKALEEEDQRLLCVCLNHQTLKTSIKEPVGMMSAIAQQWLVDYETDLLMATRG